MMHTPLNGAARRAPRAGSPKATFTRAALFGLFAGALLALGACESVSMPSSGPILSPRDGGAREEAPQRDDRRAVVDNLVTPPHRAAASDSLVRVGLLLPLSARSPGVRAEAESMLNAAQLALFETGADRIVLIPKDTGGTADGARNQARAVLREGANVLLGPLLSESVRTAADEASVYNVPVIAFSRDREAAETGAYILNRTPEVEVERIIQYASYQGLVTFASLAPSNDLGLRVRAAAEEAARSYGGFLVTWEEYPEGGDAAMIDQPARRLARYDQRLIAREAEEEEEFELPYDAVLLPEGGRRLLAVAPLLPYYDVDPRITKFLGTSDWQDPEIAREPSITGAWFPGPDGEARAAFEASYIAAYGEPPSRYASMAYNAVLVTASLTRGLGVAGMTPEALERPTGFRGADGLFRFTSDRLSEHAMAIYEVRNGGFVVIEPAPITFEPRAF